jgi:probable aminopeptidase NPEPL1
MYSGKTVEINNTDAEGRLVVGDGVAYATKHLNPDVVLDIATLTGAVLTTVGKKHGGVLSNDALLEESLIKIGKQTGDLLFPLLCIINFLFFYFFI